MVSRKVLKLYVMKSHKMDNSSAAAEAREKIGAYLEMCRILDIFWCMFGQIWKISNFTT
jgi:hypothetical protein